MENTLANDIEEVELDIEIAKEKIALGDALGRLKHNPDFKKVFMEGYLTIEPARIVKAMADPNMQDEKYQRSFHSAIRAIGQFNQYMVFTAMTADQAEKILEDAEDTRQELLREEA